MSAPPPLLQFSLCSRYHSLSLCHILNILIACVFILVVRLSFLYNKGKINNAQRLAQMPTISADNAYDQRRSCLTISAKCLTISAKCLTISAKCLRLAQNAYDQRKLTFIVWMLTTLSNAYTRVLSCFCVLLNMAIPIGPEITFIEHQVAIQCLSFALPL